MWGDAEAGYKKALEDKEARVRDLEADKRQLAGEVRSLREKGMKFDEL